MELRDAVRRRRMVRRFDPARQVPGEVLRRIAELATHAPSAGFTQGWDFVVLRSAEERSAYWDATTDDSQPPDRWLRGVRSAPTLIVCVGDPGAYTARYGEADKAATGLGTGDRHEWPAPYWQVDTGMAAMLMLLGAEDTGLGALFFAVPTQRQQALRDALGIPADRVLVGTIALGYPLTRAATGSTRKRAKRTVDDVFHTGRLSEPFRVD